MHSDTFGIVIEIMANFSLNNCYRKEITGIIILGRVVTMIFDSKPLDFIPFAKDLSVYHIR